MQPKIVYIHGLNSSHRSFKFISTLMGRDDDVFVDYDSRQPLEASVQQVLKQIPKKQPVVLVGHSLGGVIALVIAARKLVNVERVITISSPLGGSRFATWARWVASGIPLLGDITPHSRHILEIKTAMIDVPVFSIISTGGSLPTSTEPNDSVVSVSSQTAFKGAKKFEVKANHFEVLMHERTVEILKKLVEDQNG